MMLDKIIKIISEQLDVEPEKITPETRLMDDLKADSMDLVEMVMAFEEEFGISIPDEDAEKLVKVQDVLTYLETKLQG
ncbi:MAG: acyl carrier protein [Syntrophomonadaceae bacterium]|nr:acyl carrier protein [Syntrophomonadaceae bacterium]